MSGAPRGDAAAPLFLARDATLYLLSLLSVASARIAWLPSGALALLAHALLLALATVLGKLLADVAAPLGTSAGRRRSRVVFLGAYAALFFVALIVATAGGEMAAREAEAFGALHTALLLLTPTLALDIAVLANALLLVVLASLPGGAPAAVAATGFLGLVAFFLAFDHAGRQLEPWPSARARLLGPVTAGAARLVAPVVLGLGVLFSIAPPRAYARAAAGHGTRESGQAGAAYRWLALLALGGGGLTLLLGRLLRSRRGEDAPLVEPIEAHAGLEEPLEPAQPDAAAYGSPQARIIRAYVRFLARAREQGFRLPGHTTPREVEVRVREPARPLALLTTLFMDARYGPDTPAALDVGDAEAASRTLVSALTRRPSQRRGSRSG